jgi:hypothetical protein
VDEINRKTASIFEASDWQRLFSHMSEIENDANSKLWWKFFGTVCYIPGSLRNVRNLFIKKRTPSQYLEENLKVLERVEWMYEMMHASHALYLDSSPHPSSLFDVPEMAETPDRIRLREFYLYGMLLISRILATVSPSEQRRAASETEAQSLANQVLLIEKKTIELDPILSWHLEQRNALPYSIIGTRDDWLSEQSSEVQPRNVLGHRWLKWESSWLGQVISKGLGEVCEG